QVGSPFNAPVLAMETYSGFLVAGGEFTGLVSVTDPLLAHVAVLEGDEWSQLADGADAPVRAMLTAGDDLYVGGDLFFGETPAFGLGRLSSMGTAFQLMLTPSAAFFDPSIQDSRINDLALHGDDLYFGGRFFLGTMNLMGQNLGVIDIATLAVEPMIILDNDVHSTAMDEERLVIGGAFALTYPYVVTLDLTTGIPVREALQFTIYPNPVENALLITSEDLELLSTIEVFDAAGRPVAVPFTRVDRKLQLNVEDLANGSYMVRANSAKGPIGAQFVKE
nr:T9SS type A sorting domain-containing protein [Bacteroidota bacterium]